MAKRAKPQPRDAPADTPADAITSIHLPKEMLTLLRIAAIKRAEREGGRPSVSTVIRDLLERHRAEIEKEADG
jgi:hypothetical protein